MLGVGANIRQDQRNFVRNLNEQGILDDNFERVLQLRNIDNPRFVVDVINMFCSDADTSIAELNRYLYEPFIDYARVISFVHQLRGSSSCIGGCRMALACRELRYACDDMNRARCLEAFNKVKEEYQILKDKFDIISQMERNILSSEGRTRGRQP